MESGNLESGVDLCQFKGSPYLTFNIETAAPAYIAAQHKPAQLAKRHSTPLHIEL